MGPVETLMDSSDTSPVPEFLHDNDLLFQQLPLPEQLLQSDEKDGEDDSSNSVSGIHGRGLNRSRFDLAASADEQGQQDQTKVSMELQHPG